MVKDIRLADNTGQALKILSDRIEDLARRNRPSSGIVYWGVASAPFDGAGPTATVSASGGATISQVVIPDPGYPYRVGVSAGVFLQGLSATAGASHYVAARVGSSPYTLPSTALGTGMIGARFIGQMGGSSSAFSHATFSRTSPTVWTGAQTVSFSLLTGAAGSVTVPIPLAGRSDFYFEVRVTPVTA